MSIYQHFREEERNFVDQALDWKRDVGLFYTHKLTDFLDPREQAILQLIIGTNDEIGLSFWGGIPNCERKRAIIFPTYIEPAKEDFKLAFFQLRYPKKFITLTHRDVLGSLMSLGMKREKYGDILMEEDSIQLVIAQEVAQYVELNLEAIGQAKIKLIPIAETELLPIDEEWEEATSTVTSLRLDAVLSEIYHLSRAKVSTFIEKGFVKVNWKTVEQPSFTVEEGDHFSLRGFGRSRLITLDGVTKKGKWRFLYGKRK